MDRRRFLQLGASGVGFVTAARLAGVALPAGAATDDAPFEYGVASGDPLSDRLVLWTRLTPSPDAGPGSGLGSPTEVAWEVATGPDFASVVRRGTVTTSAARDHTVKIDVDGLAPSTSYAYRFLALGATSPTGTARTAPADGTDPGSVRFGVASCSNWTGGFFAAYGHLADRDDLDFVLHLGDYLYEYGNGADRYGEPGLDPPREHDPPTEIITLSDYRRRHALYKTDPDLRRLHARHPFITTWDDHEVSNDTWRDGAENHDAGEGDFATRKATAYQAYFEWMPIRLPDPDGDPTRIYRRFGFGDLADLHMLDLRQYRDQQVADPIGPELGSTERSITGDTQMAWVKDGLSASPARWHLIGNSVMITPVVFGDLPGDDLLPAPVHELVAQLTGGVPVKGVPYNVDQWDGYRADQLELLEHLAGGGDPSAAIANTVFLTGDIHSSWACDLPLDVGGYPLTSPSVAVELVGTSVTSDNLDEILRGVGLTPELATTGSIAVEEGIILVNRHIKLLEFRSHGYSVCDVTADRLQMDWYFLADHRRPGSPATFFTAWQAVDGTNRVQPAGAPLGPRVGTVSGGPEADAPAADPPPATATRPPTPTRSALARTGAGGDDLLAGLGLLATAAAGAALARRAAAGSPSPEPDATTT
ncbi:alkaline phosphatase D family protein [soil metagenome]